MGKEFTVTIKAARINAGYTLLEMAEKLDINRSTLSRYENGEISPPFKIVQLICQLTNTPISLISVGK